MAPSMLVETNDSLISLILQLTENWKKTIKGNSLILSSGYNFKPKALFCTAAHLNPQFPCLGLSIQNFVLLPFWLNN